MNIYQDDEFDTNVFPLAYLITVRTFGTWLHGDERTSVDQRRKNIYGTPRISRNRKMENQMILNMKEPNFVLENQTQRECVEKTIVEVCKHRKYSLKAVNVRTNHFHAVVSAQCNLN